MSDRRMAPAGACLGVCAALAAAAVACDTGDPEPATLSVARTLADADTAGYARATAPRPFRFPEDHGPHPDFRHEWWYFTGHLAIGSPGTEKRPVREIGFQLTFFRSALRPDSIAMPSPWATRQVYMGHFALTDITGGSFRAFERFDRAALGLAGADADPLRVWIGDWEAEALGDGFRIRAAEEEVAIDLDLRPTQPIVLQGDDGLSRKGPEPGNASYYYSMKRLAAVGTVAIDGARHAARGEAWLDREWSTSALSPGIAGWDWFALQLDDDSELMLYRLRADDGGTSPFSAATHVAPDGTVTRFVPADFEILETGSWRSPRGGRYPSGWRIRVPRLELDLRVDPRLADQELDLAFRYWEGAVAVAGAAGGRPVAGRGYVELTGYADTAAP